MLYYYSGTAGSEGPLIEECILIKTDSEFVPQWKQRRGGAVIALNDSSILAFDGIGNYDTTTAGVQKLALDGHVEWTKLFINGNAWIQACFNPVVINGRIRITGSFQTHDSTHLFTPIFIDIDSNGNFIAADTISGGNTFIEHAFTDDSGNYYLVQARLFVGYTVGISKLLPDNTVAWSYNVPIDYRYITCMLPLPNGDVIFGGNYLAAVDSPAMFLLKMSAAGDMIWQRASTKNSNINAMQLLNNGNIAISAGGIGFEAWGALSEDDIIVIDTAANVLWARNIDPDRTTWPFYTGLSVPYERCNGQWYFTGLTRNPHAASVFSTDSLCIGHCASTAVPFNFYDTTIFTLTAGTIEFASLPITMVDISWTSPIQSQTYIDSCDYALPEESVTSITYNTADLTIYPNPASGEVTISNVNNTDLITIFGVTGIMALPPQHITAPINVSGLKSGSYIVRISRNDSAATYKQLVIMH